MHCSFLFLFFPNEHSPFFFCVLKKNHWIFAIYHSFFIGSALVDLFARRFFIGVCFLDQAHS